VLAVVVGLEPRKEGSRWMMMMVMLTAAAGL
jgi:hypothetical protein